MTTDSPAAGAASPASAAPRLIALLAGAMLLAPLVALSGVLLFPQVTPKAVLAWTIGLLCGALLVPLLLSRDPARRFRWTPISVAVAVTVWSLGISTFLGVDAGNSLWHSSGRMTGVFLHVCLVLWFVATATAVRGDEAWQRLFRTLVVVTVLVAVAAFADVLRPGTFGGEFQGRGSATLGNPVFLGGFGAVSALLCWLSARQEPSRGWRALARLGSLLAVVAIVLSGTRASWIALGAGVGVMLVTDVTAHGRRRLTAAALALVVAAVASPVLLSRIDATRELPLAERFDDSLPMRSSIRTRQNIWTAAIAAAAERPLAGYGPGNFGRAFDEHYRPEYLRERLAFVYADDAHSEPLDALATRGVPGLLAYVLLFGSLVFVLVRGIRRGTVAHPVGAAALGVVAARLVHGLVSPADISSLVLLFFVLAFVDSRDAPPTQTEPRAATRRARLVSVALVGGALTLASVLGVQTVAGSADARSAIASVSGGSADAAARIAEVTRSDSPYAGGDCAVVAGRVGDHSAKRRRGESDVLRAALDCVRRARAERPFDLRPALTEATLAVALNDPAELRSSKELLGALSSFHPRRQEVWFGLSRVVAAQGDRARAIELVRRGYDLDRGTGLSTTRLAQSYVGSGRSDDARELLLRARAEGVTLDPNGQLLLERLSEPE